MSKSIIKIQSISDVITNSSSEVFVVKSEYDGDELIDWDWISNGGKWEINMICSVCDIPYPGNLYDEREVDNFIELTRILFRKN